VDGSPDGQWLTWVSFPGQTLWKSRVDGSDRLRLSGPGWQVHLPRWSPDGRQIVFAGRDGGKDGLGLYRVAAEGGEPEILVPWDPRLGNLWDPCWLPDGGSVVYSHLGRTSSLQAGLSTEGAYPGGIYRLDLESREVTRLPGSEAFTYPKCSAQGDILAMDGSAGEGLWSYSVYSVDRATWEAIGTWGWAYPSWSRDGETITAYNQKERRIERWSRRTGRLEVVADASDIPLASWANAGWMGLAPDGSPLIMRDRSTRDLYALEWEAP
jgi:WD40 repeat protein